jgi:hypothetical protein
VFSKVYFSFNFGLTGLVILIAGVGHAFATSNVTSSIANELTPTNALVDRESSYNYSLIDKVVAPEITLPDLGGDVQNVVSTKTPLRQIQHGNMQDSFGNAIGGYFFSDKFITPGAGPDASRNLAHNASVNIGDASVGASIGATAANAKFESKNYIANIGFNYLSPGSSYGLGVKADGSILMGESSAIGANLSVNKNMKEVVLNGVWMPEGTNLKAKLSGAYMWGSQNFDFFSGNSQANVGQASFYFSTQYVVPKDQSDFFHSIGISTWGTQARQTNNPETIYSVVQTSSSYQIMSDPQKLAVGTLQGESLDTQFGITKQMIAKVALGYETLKFPFSDGSQELDTRMYQDYLIQYLPTEKVLFQAGYKSGAALNNIMLSAAYNQLKITLFKNDGINGVTGNQGVILSFSVPLDGAMKSSAFNKLSRPELIGNSNYILRDANTRPVQLPQAFLAKVDTTAVRALASINKAGLPNEAVVDSAGNVMLLVGVGGGSITGITRNGASYYNTATARIVGLNLMIYTRQFPAAVSGGDTYVYSVTDSGGTPYLVTINTQN